MNRYVWSCACHFILSDSEWPVEATDEWTDKMTPTEDKKWETALVKKEKEKCGDCVWRRRSRFLAAIGSSITVTIYNAMFQAKPVATRAVNSVSSKMKWNCKVILLTSSCLMQFQLSHNNTKEHFPPSLESAYSEKPGPGLISVGLCFVNPRFICDFNSNVILLAQMMGLCHRDFSGFRIWSGCSRATDHKWLDLGSSWLGVLWGALEARRSYLTRNSFCQQRLSGVHAREAQGRHRDSEAPTDVTTKMTSELDETSVGGAHSSWFCCCCRSNKGFLWIESSIWIK